MQSRSLFRAFMIVVGITATFVIVLSQAIPEIAGPEKEKAKTEQTENDADLKIHATPSDVVPGGVIQMNDVDRFLLETITSEEEDRKEFYHAVHIFSGYLNILFRAFISPNAP